MNAARRRTSRSPGQHGAIAELVTGLSAAGRGRTSLSTGQGRTFGTFIALLTAAATLAACGARPEIERQAAQRAATQCADRTGAERVESLPAGTIAATVKPVSEPEPVIGFAGSPPVALTYETAGSQSGGADLAGTTPSATQQVVFAIVPGSADPTRDTTIDEAAEIDGTLWLISGVEQAGTVSRCLVGRGS